MDRGSLWMLGLIVLLGLGYALVSRFATQLYLDEMMVFYEDALQADPGSFDPEGELVRFTPPAPAPPPAPPPPPGPPPASAILNVVVAGLAACALVVAGFVAMVVARTSPEIDPLEGLVVPAAPPAEGADAAAADPPAPDGEGEVSDG